MASRTSNLADVAAQFLGTVVARGCYMGLQIVLARSLGAPAFGLYAIGWTVAGLVGTLTPVGMPQAVLRYSVGGRHALRSAPMIIVTSTGLIAMIVLIAMARPIAVGLFGDPAAAPVIVAFAPSIPLSGMAWLLNAALRVSHANLASAVVGAALFPLYLGVTLLVFLSVGRSPAAAGYAYAAAIALTLPAAAWLLHRLPSAADAALPRLRQLLRFGRITMFTHSANLLNLWADRLVIGMMTDAQAVGIYQVASQLAMVAIVLRAATTTVFEARVPKSARTKSGAEGTPDVTREYFAASRLLLHMSAPGLICLMLSARFWIDALFGRAYGAAALPLSLLVAGQLALSFAGPSLTALQMTGEERTAMRLTTATCLLNVVGNVALIPLLGLAGSAVASGIANILAGWGALWRLRRTGRLRPYLGSLADVALATLASAAATILAARWLGSASLPAALAALAAAYAAYAGVVLTRCRVEDEAVAFARALLRRACQKALVP